MFERKDAALKFKRGRNAFLECSVISVTWERESNPITWTWNRTSAMKGICRAHWDGPSTAYTEDDIRQWCRARMEAIEAQEAQDAMDPVKCY